MKLTTILAIAALALAMTSCACGDRRGRGGRVRSDRGRRATTTTQPAVPAAPSAPVASPSATPAPATGAMSATDVYQRYNSAVFTVLTNRSQGSGFFVSADGLAVSNWHVFDGKEMYRIQTSDGSRYWVDRIVAYDADADYAVFRVRCDVGKSFNFLPVSRRGFQIGDIVYAIGSPKGLTNTLSTGNISQIRDDEYSIQISVPIDHGSSGGALINTYGEVIGITSAGYDDTHANLNFAIDIRKLSRWLP